MGFYGSNDPTNSVKALKEVVVLRIGFNPPSPPHHVTILQHLISTKYTYTKYIYTKMNLSTVKWAQ